MAEAEDKQRPDHQAASLHGLGLIGNTDFHPVIFQAAQNRFGSL
ncbi:MAG TPA: hypothetical protein VHD90_20870 [Phototrophicaceae bacterium]|nr:hypothetical protein [Phototrophicaceae bacterium]